MSKKITKITPAASANRKVSKVVTLKDEARETREMIAAIKADVQAEERQTAASFTAMVLENKKVLLSTANKAAGARDAIRGIVLKLAQHAKDYNMKRADAGRLLAESLGLTKLIDNKDISNAWQYAAKLAGLESRKSGTPSQTTGGSVAGGTDGGESESDSAGGSVASGASVVIPKDASAADVVTAFHAWVKAHKGPGREALEIIATWKEMTAAVGDVAKLAKAA
jgi:hypothetical protein